jgi:hypothetical protein
MSLGCCIKAGAGNYKENLGFSRDMMSRYNLRLDYVLSLFHTAKSGFERRKHGRKRDCAGGWTAVGWLDAPHF